MDVYEETRAFYETYRGEKRVIGRSAEGREIFAMLIGRRAKPLGISQYAIHGREWICALLGLEHVRRGLTRGGVWVVPLANPDGACLSAVGLSAVSEARRETLLALNGGSADFSCWKANAEGVDLNVNFDARWGTGKKNVRRPAAENYIGSSPFCAPESRALRDFTLEVSPDFTVSWHTRGEEIYWKFRQPVYRAARDKRLARILSRSTGYPLREEKGSAGGYKDWCVEKLKIPAFTVETGRDDIPHPLGLPALPSVLGRSLDALADLTEGF